MLPSDQGGCRSALSLGGSLPAVSRKRQDRVAEPAISSAEVALRCWPCWGGFQSCTPPAVLFAAQAPQTGAVDVPGSRKSGALIVFAAWPCGRGIAALLFIFDELGVSGLRIRTDALPGSRSAGYSGSAALLGQTAQKTRVRLPSPASSSIRFAPEDALTQIASTVAHARRADRRTRFSSHRQQ